MKRAMCGLWLCLLGCSTAQAQLAAYDFSNTECAAELGLLRAGFEDDDLLSASGGPSGGAGGAFPGEQSLSVFVPDTGSTRTVLVYLPATYSPTQAWPVVVALHGTAGSPENALVYANAARAIWKAVADREGAIVLATVASGASGSWVPNLDQPVLACALDAVARQYNVDLDRRYLWGFSAGGHFGHALALGNSGRFAAYAVNAGALYSLACAPPGEAYDCAVTLPQVARRVPVSLRVGHNDPLRPYAAGDYTRFQSAGWAADAEVAYGQFYGGHTYSGAEIEAAWAWFAPRRLP